jgi:hypothetical protein
MLRNHGPFILTVSWIRIGFDLMLIRNADPDPYPGQSLTSLKVEFYMKNILKVGNLVGVIKYAYRT